jgi:hypothetical protein
MRYFYNVDKVMFADYIQKGATTTTEDKYPEYLMLDGTALVDTEAVSLFTRFKLTEHGYVEGTSTAPTQDPLDLGRTSGGITIEFTTDEFDVESDQSYYPEDTQTQGKTMSGTINLIEAKGEVLALLFSGQYNVNPDANNPGVVGEITIPASSEVVSKSMFIRTRPNSEGEYFNIIFPKVKVSAQTTITLEKGSANPFTLNYTATTARDNAGNIIDTGKFYAIKV